MKKKLIIFAIVGLILTTGTVLAAEYSSPLDILSKLTGNSYDNYADLRQEGKTLGQLANEEGVLEEFKNEMFNLKKQRIEEKVKEGYLTQDKADEIIENIQSRIEDCTGDGERLNLRMGFGSKGNGNRQGRGGFGCFR